MSELDILQASPQQSDIPSMIEEGRVFADNMAAELTAFVRGAIKSAGNMGEVSASILESKSRLTHPNVQRQLDTALDGCRDDLAGVNDRFSRAYLAATILLQGQPVPLFTPELVAADFHKGRS